MFAFAVDKISPDEEHILQAVTFMHGETLEKVTVIPTVHLASPEFFEQVEEIANQCNKVIYEGVRDIHPNGVMESLRTVYRETKDGINRNRGKQIDNLPINQRETIGLSSEEISLLRDRTKELHKVVFQYDALDTNKPNWTNIDATEAELKEQYAYAQFFRQIKWTRFKIVRWFYVRRNIQLYNQMGYEAFLPRTGIETDPQARAGDRFRENLVCQSIEEALAESLSSSTFEHSDLVVNSSSSTLDSALSRPSIDIPKNTLEEDPFYVTPEILASSSTLGLSQAELRKPPFIAAIYGLRHCVNIGESLLKNGYNYFSATPIHLLPKMPQELNLH